LKQLNLKSFSYITLIIFYPLFTLIVIGGKLIPSYKDYIKEVIAFGMLSFIFFVAYFLIKRIRFRKLYLAIVYFILFFFLIIKLSFYYNFKAKLSSSVLYLMFETNKEEASEFLTSYLDYKLGLLYLFYIVSFLMLLFFLYKKKNDLTKLLNLKIQFKFHKISSVITLLVVAFLIQYKLSDENILIKSMHSYKEYNNFKKRFKEVLSLNKNENIKTISSKDEAQTYVVVIGESTSRWHMQLYDYHRDTNPLLISIKDELLIFNDVITTDVHTILALEKILTQIDFKNQNSNIDNASIIQLANKADFTTYWVSNQRPVGFHESVPSLIGNAADYKYFLNTQDYDAIAYDEILLPTLDTILDDSNKKRIIFLHLMGTHLFYKNRYPKKHNYFKDNNVKTKFKTDKSIISINEYDNSIRYNDSIVSEIIKKVKSKNLNSYVLYFSDHGDELYDTFDFMGHNSYYSTKPMHDVPFILWLSEKYKSNYPNFITSDTITNRSYILEDFFHSFSDLSNIKFKDFNKEKSIFNANFKRKPRIIKKGDYDKMD